MWNEHSFILRQLTHSHPLTKPVLLLAKSAGHIQKSRSTRPKSCNLPPKLRRREPWAPIERDIRTPPVGGNVGDAHGIARGSRPHLRSDIDIGLASRTIESHPSPHPSATAVGWRVKTVSVWQHRRSTNAASTATPMNNTNRRAPSCTPGVGRKVRRFAPREHMPRPHRSRRRPFKRHALRRTLPMREEGARIVESRRPRGVCSQNVDTGEVRGAPARPRHQRIC